jgi:hypothetical protein
MGTTALDIELDALYQARRGVVEVVDVPDLAMLVVDGTGRPEGPEFTDAVQTLFAVSYGAHFLVRQQRGEAPRVMPLEALWDPPGDGAWAWRALVVQPPPVDARVVAAALDRARRRPPPVLDRVRFERWTEGRCAQLLHLGPYASEGPSIDLLQREIAASGLRPRGRHHEIYLSDPRRSRPERLRTILRQPVEPA